MRLFTCLRRIHLKGKSWSSLDWCRLHTDALAGPPFILTRFKSPFLCVSRHIRMCQSNELLYTSWRLELHKGGRPPLILLLPHHDNFLWLHHWSQGLPDSPVHSPRLPSPIHPDLTTSPLPTASLLPENFHAHYRRPASEQTTTKKSADQGSTSRNVSAGHAHSAGTD